MEEKACTKCHIAKPLTEDFFYRARPTATHKKGGWQSYCKLCWKLINKLNKQKIHEEILNTQSP